MPKRNHWRNHYLRWSLWLLIIDEQAAYIATYDLFAILFADCRGHYVLGAQREKQNQLRSAQACRSWVHFTNRNPETKTILQNLSAETVRRHDTGRI